MKIGIIDSGLGGLVVLKGIIKELPQYDYVYLGDTKNSPYGTKTHDELYELALPIVEYLFKEKNCKIIILACNSLSSQALRRLQKEYLPNNFPDRRILGVLIPVAEYVSERYETVGVLGTVATVDSNAYLREIHKINNSIKVIQKSATDLVDYIEMGLLDSLIFEDSLYFYSGVIGEVDAIIPGCTHFPLMSDKLSKISKKEVVNAPKVIAESLSDYLKRHPEIESKLNKANIKNYYLTDTTVDYNKLTKILFGEGIKFNKIET